MVSRKIFILNLLSDEFVDDILFHMNQKILSFCSVIKEFFVNTDPTSQIAIILLKNGMIQQISHLSGNKSHHNQGLVRSGSKPGVGNNTLEDAVFFAKNLLLSSDGKFNQEIILFTGEKYNYSFLHSLGGFFIKNKIKFSTILFNTRIFLFEILTKITGGFLMIFNNDRKFDLVFQLNSKKHRDFLRSDIFNLNVGNFHSKFFFNFLMIDQKKKVLSKVRLLCLRCNFIFRKFYAHVCPTCSIFNIEGVFFSKKPNGRNFLFNNLNFTELKFSIFTAFFFRKKKSPNCTIRSSFFFQIGKTHLSFLKVCPSLFPINSSLIIKQNATKIEIFCKTILKKKTNA